MSNIIARMGEVLPTVFRGAGQWLAVSRKYEPLGKAIAEEFGESINAHAFGHWLLKRIGESTEGVTLTSKYSTNRKQWLYRVGHPPDYVPDDWRSRVAPAGATPRQLAHAEPIAAHVPVPKVEAPRHVARFSSPNIVQGPSGPIIRNAEPVTPVSVAPPEPEPEPVPQPVAPVPEPQHLTHRDRRPDVVRARALHEAAQAAGAAVSSDWKWRGAIHTHPSWNPYN